MKYLLTTIAVLVTISLSSQDVRSSVSGFSIEADIVYGEWHTNSAFIGDLAELEPSGGGLAFKLGYGFRERYEVFGSYTIVNFLINEEWDRFLNTNMKLGGRVHFGATLKRFRPYIEVAVSINNFVIDPIFIGGTEGPFVLDMSGIGFSPAVGTNYFLTTNLALHANASFVFGNFGRTEIDGQLNEFEEKLDFTFFNVGLGISYFFQ